MTISFLRSAGLVAAARERAYEAVGTITFDGMQARPDIAERAVKARTGELDLFPAGFAG